ncbi:hypothetical protein HAX54_029706 [Datura stramonium]|uniref:Uncharacterized protein n=1 Tax=Datura stramonium TaxID=4076 RepID=A0ABS8V8J9_DATST|nr:hypothetical protein [Datura stramonium]
MAAISTSMRSNGPEGHHQSPMVGHIADISGRMDLSRHEIQPPPSLHSEMGTLDVDLVQEVTVSLAACHNHDGEGDDRRAIGGPPSESSLIDNMGDGPSDR